MYGNVVTYSKRRVFTEKGQMRAEKVASPWMQVERNRVELPAVEPLRTDEDQQSGEDLEPKMNKSEDPKMGNDVAAKILNSQPGRPPLSVASHPNLLISSSEFC